MSFLDDNMIPPSFSFDEFIFCLQNSIESKRYIFLVNTESKKKYYKYFKIKTKHIEKIYYYEEQIINMFKYYSVIMSLRKKNNNSNIKFVFLIGKEFLLHPQPLLSQYSSYICRDNINIFLNVIISFFFNHLNDNKRKYLYNIIYKDVENNNNNNNNFLLSLSEIEYMLKNPYPLEMLSIVFILQHTTNDNIITQHLSHLKHKISYYKDIFLIIENIKELKNSFKPI